MLWLLFFRSPGQVEGLSYVDRLRNNFNITPLYTIRNYIHVLMNSNNGALVRHCFINLVGNVVMFIPAGYLVSGLWKSQRNLLVFLLTCIALILTIELVQLLTLLGSFDVDDLILNLAGMFLGYLLCLICRPK